MCTCPFPGSNVFPTSATSSLWPWPCLDLFHCRHSSLLSWWSARLPFQQAHLALVKARAFAPVPTVPVNARQLTITKHQITWCIPCLSRYNSHPPRFVCVNYSIHRVHRNALAMRPDQVPPSPSRRGPAMVVGGQRRRLTRRSALTRSRTTPVLQQPGSPAATSSKYANDAGQELPRQEASLTADTGSASEQHMEFYSPLGMVVPTETQSSSKERPSTAKVASSAPNTDSTSKAVDDRKQRQHNGNKTTALVSDGQWPEQQLPISPLPPSTPCKAAQFLGLSPEMTNIEHSKMNKPLDEYHQAQDNSSVRNVTNDFLLP